MIEKFGIGIDITSIQKFKKKPFKINEGFYKLIFSQAEIRYCLKFKKKSFKTNESFYKLIFSKAEIGTV